MKQGGPIRRKTPLQAKGPIRRSSGAFTGKNTQRRKRGPKERRMRALDDAFSLWVRGRDKTCQARVASQCDGTFRLQCAHIFSRRHGWTRWDARNAVALCWRCHGYFTHQPAKWTLWVIERLGEGPYMELLRRTQLDSHPPLDEAEDWLLHGGEQPVWAGGGS